MSMLRHQEAEEAESLLRKTPSGNSLSTSAVLVLVPMVSSAILIQPYVFKESGVGVAPVLYFCIILANYVGSTYLLDVMGNRRIFDYADLAQDLLGRVGWLCVHFGIIFQNIGCIICYFILLGSMLQSIIITFAGGDSDWYTDLFFLTGMCIILASPLTIFHNYSDMIWVTLAILVMILIIFLYVTIVGSLDSSTYSGLGTTISSGVGVTETIGFILFALGVSASIPSIYVSSENSDRSVFDKVLLGSQGAAGVLLLVLGVVGYLSFRTDTQVNIMDNFAGTTASILKCIVLAFLLIYIPTCTVIARNSIYVLTGAIPNDESTLSLLGMSGLLLTVNGFIAVVLAEYYGSTTALSYSVNLTGGIFMSFLSFGLPGILAQRCPITNSDRYTVYVSWALILCWVCSTVMVITGVLLESI